MIAIAGNIYNINDKTIESFMILLGNQIFLFQKKKKTK